MKIYFRLVMAIKITIMITTLVNIYNNNNNNKHSTIVTIPELLLALEDEERRHLAAQAAEIRAACR